MYAIGVAAAAVTIPKCSMSSLPIARLPPLNENPIIFSLVNGDDGALALGVPKTFYLANVL